MNVDNYKQEFIKLYMQMCQEHGEVKYIIIQDNTSAHWNQVENGDRWIDVEIRF